VEREREREREKEDILSKGNRLCKGFKVEERGHIKENEKIQ
jgi:hypothetical protein